jgi:hypothetical protein
VSEIKSAWEIAQEKASKLGGLSVEEREEQRQEKCRLTGEALADRYLSHHDIAIIKDELDKHEAADKELIAKAAVLRLSEAIDLQYPDRLAEISQGILALKNGESTKKTLGEITGLFEDYGAINDRERQDIEKAAGEILHQMRISGSAVGHINSRARKEWLEQLEQTASPFNDRLDLFKQKLTQ